MKRPLQQCVALLKDGTRCGKFAKAGETLCAVHQPGYVPKGAAVPKPKVLTHQQRLEMFAQSSDERIAMQAISLLEKRRGTQESSPREESAALVAALTDDERDQLAAIIGQLKAFKEQIYLRRPDLRPAGYRLPDDDPVVMVPTSTPTQVEPAPKPQPVVEKPRGPQASEPYSLPRDLYDQVGLETLPSGEVTHPLGDEYAQNVVNGTISFDEARAQHQSSLHELNRFDASPTKPRRIP